MSSQILLEIPSRGCFRMTISGQQEGAKHSLILISTFKLSSAEHSDRFCLQQCQTLFGFCEIT